MKGTHTKQSIQASNRKYKTLYTCKIVMYVPKNGPNVTFQRNENLHYLRMVVK